MRFTLYQTTIFRDSTCQFHAQKILPQFRLSQTKAAQNTALFLADGSLFSRRIERERERER